MLKIFLDLHKSYDALDRDRCLEILTAYVVAPQALLLLRQCWDLLTMVARARGYFGIPFKGYLRVTQGDPLSPTIFNMFVYVVLRHLVTMVSSMEEAVDHGTSGTEGFRRDVYQLAEYFYADDGILAPTWSSTPPAGF